MGPRNGATGIPEYSATVMNLLADFLKSYDTK